MQVTYEKLSNRRVIKPVPQLNDKNEQRTSELPSQDERKQPIPLSHNRQGKTREDHSLYALSLLVLRRQRL